MSDRLALLVLLLAAPAAAPAQGPGLVAVDSLIAAGRYDEARARLGDWWQQAGDAESGDRVRALMLRARLHTDPVDAEPDYLAVVLGYPASAEAPEALLRLGQGLMARGEPQRAVAYLQRLAADYPGSRPRVVGMLWLTRALRETGRNAAACEAARDGLGGAGADVDLAALLRIEESASCRLAGSGEATAGSGPFAVQTGAFRQRETADALAERLRRAGFQPRAAFVPNSSLLRIRVGRFQDAEEARRLLTRLRAAGFDAVVVRDAHRERPGP